MANKKIKAVDVALFICKEYKKNSKSELSGMKLQKLLYYSQAWSLVWDIKPLFNEKIEAWVSGPVIREIYDLHKRFFPVEESVFKKGNVSKLIKEQISTIKAVLKYYGGKQPQWLSDLTHREEPWKIAREGLSPRERGNREITLASMEEYYSSL